MTDPQPVVVAPVDPNGAGGAPTQLPDDHPLVKTLAAQKDEIKVLKEKAARKILLTATEPAALLEQVKAIQILPAAKSGRAPLQGRTPTQGAADPMRDFTRGLFGLSLIHISEPTR